MEFTIRDEVASYLVTAVKKDDKLAKAIAKDFVNNIDLQALALYLVPSEVAVELLVARLQKDPDVTLADLKKLAEGKSVRPPRKAKRGRPAGKVTRKRAPAAKAKAKAKAKAPAKAPAKPKKKAKVAGTRKRMTPAQAAEVKATILAFLKANPWASRREIADKAGLSSMAVYTRLMGELRKEKKVISRGTKAKMVYALTGAKVPAAKKAPAKKAPAKKKPAARKPAAKKAPAKKAPAKNAPAKK